MKIVVAGHSMVATRQHMYFKVLAGLGHEVTLIGPGEWGNTRATWDQVDFPNGGSYKYIPCRHMAEDLYTFRFLGAADQLDFIEPDWLYIQQEPGSTLAADALNWSAARRAIFTWENIDLKPGSAEQLPEYDLVICGNPAAVELVKPHNSRTELMLQVGVDTDHFQQREQMDRHINVGYVGRMTPEKGIPYLVQAWPTFQKADWTPFIQLPWVYSQIKTLIAFSQDIPYWREQAPNYVVLEALSCGCNVVISSTPAMKSWLDGYPGVYVAEGHKQQGVGLDLVRIRNLKEAIQMATENFEEGAGRQMIIDRFGSQNHANRLINMFSDFDQQCDGE